MIGIMGELWRPWISGRHTPTKQPQKPFLSQSAVRGSTADFAACDRVNHGGLVFKLWEPGVGGLILRVFQNFLSSRTQRVKVDGVFSSSIDVVYGVPQDSVLGPLLFLLYIADLPRLLQHELVGYADDSTLLRRIPHPRNRSSVAASLNDDLAVISDWCSRWGMLVNPIKTRGMLISRSRTVEPLSRLGD